MRFDIRKYWGRSEEMRFIQTDTSAGLEKEREREGEERERGGERKKFKLVG